ncbi:MAG: GNAT family N-acetyltransferase [Terracoccus sp.]
MAEPTLRPALPADEPAVRDLVRAAFAPYVERMGREPMPMHADHAAAIERGGVWVADVDGSVVGALEVEARPGHLYVDIVAVTAGWRGRGVGRMLLRHAGAEARRLGLLELRLLTHETMTENVALYTRTGWTDVSEPEDRSLGRLQLRKPTPDAD